MYITMYIDHFKMWNDFCRVSWKRSTFSHDDQWCRCEVVGGPVTCCEEMKWGSGMGTCPPLVTHQTQMLALLLSLSLMSVERLQLWLVDMQLVKSLHSVRCPWCCSTRDQIQGLRGFIPFFTNLVISALIASTFIGWI